jgi:hypothetical protein
MQPFIFFFAKGAKAKDNERIITKEQSQLVSEDTEKNAKM